MLKLLDNLSSIKNNLKDDYITKIQAIVDLKTPLLKEINYSEEISFLDIHDVPSNFNEISEKIIKINHEIYNEVSKIKNDKEMVFPIAKYIFAALDELYFLDSYESDALKLDSVIKTIESEVYSILQHRLEDIFFFFFEEIIFDYLEKKIGLNNSIIYDVKMNRNVVDFNERLNLIKYNKETIFSKLKNFLSNIDPKSFKISYLKFFVESKDNQFTAVYNDLKYLDNTYKNKNFPDTILSFLCNQLYKKHRIKIYMLTDYIQLYEKKNIFKLLAIFKNAVRQHTRENYIDATKFYMMFRDEYNKFMTYVQNLNFELSKVKNEIDMISKFDIKHHREIYDKLLTDNSEESKIQAEFHLEKEKYFVNLQNSYRLYENAVKDEIFNLNKLNSLNILQLNFFNKCKLNKKIENITEILGKLPKFRVITFKKFITNYKIFQIKENNERKDIWQEFTKKMIR